MIVPSYQRETERSLFEHSTETLFAAAQSFLRPLPLRDVADNSLRIAVPELYYAHFNWNRCSVLTSRLTLEPDRLSNTGILDPFACGLMIHRAVSVEHRQLK